jgi:hypothetical protein
MTSHRWIPALVALACGAAGAQAAGAAEFRCWNGDRVRKIELSGPDATQGAACEVRYWRNAAAPDTGQSLWRASRDTDFCAARARELIARLEAGGWTCSAFERAAAPARQAPRADRGLTAGARPPAPADAPVQLTPAPQPAAPDATPAAEPLLPALARTSPAAVPAPPPASAAPATRPSARPAQPPAPAVAVTAPSAVPASPPSPAAARSAPVAPGAQTAAAPAHRNAALLERVVEQTLRSVRDLYGGEFQADPAAFGDLDGDGLEDAAVLVTYQAAREEYVQYLVAYLFDGETFRSIATKNVGGRFLDAVRADLEGIADGSILVELQALEGGATCCARRRTAFALQNGQLVEVDGPGGASLERTSQTERPSSG